MLIGASTPNAGGSDYGTANAAFGPFTCRRSFNGPNDFPTTHGVPPTFAASNAHIDSGLGLVSIYSFKPDITLLISGALDSAITGFLESVPEGHKMLISTWHEPGPKVRQSMFSAAQWRDQFGHFCDLVHENGNPNIMTAFIDSAYQPSADGTKYQDFWVDAAADFMLVDGYTDLGGGDQAWKASHDFAVSKNTAWGIGEIGVRSGVVDTHWMAAQVRWAFEHDAVCLCWFDTTTGGVIATPGTGAAPVAAAMAMATLLQVDPQDDFPG